MRFFISPCSTSWELGFVSSENILSDLYHLKGTLARVYQGDQSNTLGYWDMKSQAALCPAVWNLRVICHKGSQSIRGLCHLTFVVLLVLEKSHSSNTRLVLQFSRSVIGGVSHSWGNQRYSFHYIILTPMQQRTLLS